MQDSEEVEIKNGYFKHSISSCFVTRPMLFIYYMPIMMWAYNSLKNYFIKHNYNIDWSIGMLERPKMFGFGYIGLSHTSGDRIINGEFIAYKMVGDYRNFKRVYNKIMSDYPHSRDFYHQYLTDPSVTKIENNITYILFKIR